MDRQEFIDELLRHGDTMGKHVQSLLQMRPFRPFRISMTGKSTYEITDPSTVEVRQHVAEVKIPAGRAILALEHVVSLTILPVADEPLIVKSESGPAKTE